MPEELHNLCNFASPFLHETFSDSVGLRGYLLRMNTKEESGRRIKAARLQKRLRLEDVCSQVTELTVSRLSNWEQGRNMIGVDEAKKIAPVLGISAAYILTLEDSPGHQQEQLLIDLYRKSDTRGKKAIYHIAERESAYTVDRAEDDFENNNTGTG